ncbi:MAG: 50S ribosomal protein L25/general stress protein Ctc [Bacteroidales bacterium]|nr:50S ribosomal protein L25/general stress protein Ctc [Bacteroidales bacterium]
MESITLKASLRKETGKKSSKAIRTKESVPCVLYGGKENVNFYVAEGDFRGLVYTPTVYLINLDVDGKVHNVVIKDLQFHPVTDKLLHADFYEVSEDKPLVIEVPVKITGSSMGVREGGKLVVEKRKIAVKGLVKDIPAEIAIDITELGIGKAIRAGEIEAKKIEVVVPKDTPVVSIRTTRAAAAAAAEAAKQ